MPQVIGCVPYLNARPLTRWLEIARGSDQLCYDLCYEVPSSLAPKMIAKQYACAMLSSVVYARNPQLGIVPDVAVASYGAVASVKMFCATSIPNIKRVALDTSSLTSVALVRILLTRRYGISPEFVNAPPHLPSMMADCDAAVIIGDPCMATDAQGTQEVDLGECWTEWTGLPFVWALWTGQKECITQQLISTIQHARDWGIANLAQIIEEEKSSRIELAPQVDYYIRHNVSHTFSGVYVKGFDRFREELTAVGLM